MRWHSLRLKRRGGGGRITGSFFFFSRRRNLNLPDEIFTDADPRQRQTTNQTRPSQEKSKIIEITDINFSSLEVSLLTSDWVVLDLSHNQASDVISSVFFVKSE